MDFEVSTATSGASAIREIAVDRYPVLVIELELFSLVSEELLFRLIGSGRGVVVLLSRPGSMESKLLAYRLGADDYIELPRSPAEIALRVEVIARRKLFYAKGQMVLGSLKYDYSDGAVYWASTKLNIPATAKKILLQLMRRYPYTISARELHEEVYGIDRFSSGRLRAHIFHLRSELNRFLGDGCIETIPFFGYRLHPYQDFPKPKSEWQPR
ncbi:response regulator transcription factor [Pseudomonas sp. BGr12]|uniref:response regulator transcription factor n=1 Tax=Pseudomonas sp. BGr12 TaxID=2936269 RepID=UPI002559F8E9|nr:winged helix-turn-helix domain-containing protein [Pseudomonas sp. BJa5]MDL2426291.1 winged helix-turn-helix domain-containing protein [Pseudomonas sp. BJa5]